MFQLGQQTGFSEYTLGVIKFYDGATQWRYINEQKKMFIVAGW